MLRALRGMNLNTLPECILFRDRLLKKKRDCYKIIREWAYLFFLYAVSCDDVIP